MVLKNKSMKYLKIALKIFFEITLAFVILILIYVFSVFGLSKITVNADVAQKEEIEIFILGYNYIRIIKNSCKVWQRLKKK